jgi:hypothetical protein
LDLSVSVELLLIPNGVYWSLVAAIADAIYAAASAITFDETVRRARCVIECEAEDLKAEEIAGDSWLG